MKNKSQNFVDLYFIYASVELDGVKTYLHKYRTKFTGQNYLSTMFSKEDDQNGYNIGWGSSRIPATDIMKVQRASFIDRTDKIARKIYFLEGQKNEALCIVRESLEQTVIALEKDARQLLKVWNERPNKPTE